MRSELLHPPIDQTAGTEAVALARDVFRLHEAGQPTELLLQRLSEVCGVELDQAMLKGAFGSVDAESFAKDLLVGKLRCPTDLSHDELLELIDAVCEVRGEEWQISFWLRCLETSTGCADIIDLIYYPSDVLGPDDGREQLTPEEILLEAARRPRRILVTPPPRQ
jgi:hypothetical protein